MPTSFQDVPAAAVIKAGFPPDQMGATAVGPAVELPDADLPCFAVQAVGLADGFTALDGRLQESADGTTWADIPAAAFPTVTAANTVAVLRFAANRRFVRWVAAAAGDEPAIVVAVVIGQQKKVF